MSVNYNIIATHLSICLRLNQTIIYIKELLYKISVTCDTSHIQKPIQKYGLFKSDTHTTKYKEPQS
jgi:hypothetical protein